MSGFFGSRLALSAILVLGLGACEGPTGPTGPAGPQGPEGPQGIQGPTGNANVVSGRTTLTEADWSSATIALPFQVNPNTFFYRHEARYADVEVPDITADVFSDGAVLLWLSPASALVSQHFAQIPHRFIRNGISSYTWTYDAIVTEGNIRFLFLHEAIDAAASPPSPLNITQPDRVFRWVIIPPAAASMTAGLPIDEGWHATVGELERRGFQVEFP